MLRRLSLSALILAGAFTLARADVYRWVDDHGEPHYSDQWTPGAEIIKTSKVHPPGTDSAARTTDQKNLTASNNRVATELGAQDNARSMQQDLTARRQAVCKQARDNYMKALTSRRIYKEGAGGEHNYLSDADADSYREQLRQQEQDHCGSVPPFDPNAPVPQGAL